jgi:hypothetical protein
MPNRSLVEDGDVGGPTTDVYQRHSQLSLVIGQHRFGRRQLLQHRFDHFHPGSVDTRNDVLSRRRARCDDVHVGLEATTGHAGGVEDTVVSIHHELLGQHVDDLSIRG